jgi:hypothetical protein
VTEIDVSAVIPEVRDVARAAAEVFVRHTEQWLVCLLVHGSAVKGGFIPHLSDIDFQLHLRREAFDEGGQIPLKTAVAIHRELAAIDLGIVSYIQCFPLYPGLRGEWVGPIPGAFHVVAGKLSVAPATAEHLLRDAHARLANLGPLPFDIANGLTDCGLGRLDRLIRLLATDVWPALYQVLTCATGDPLHVWTLPKDRAIELVPDGESPGVELRRFYRAMMARSAGDRSVENGLEIIVAGTGFLQGAGAWYAEFSRSHAVRTVGESVQDVLRRS